MAATAKMIQYAQAIANKLDIDEPDYANFDETSLFISDNVGEYKARLEAEYRKEHMQNPDLEYIYSKEFISLMQKSFGKCGVYALYCDDELIYIGKSINLGDRACSSLSERQKQHRITSVSICYTPNEADAHILEVILIVMLKPLLNRDCKCKCNPTMFAIDISKIKWESAQLQKEGD